MQELIKIEPQTKMTLDQCIEAWLKEKANKTKSQHTERAYRQSLKRFRDLLLTHGLDLDGQASIIAPIAQLWIGEEVTASTYNQRLACLSSFYTYAIKHEVLTSNPIVRIERRQDTKPNKAYSLSPDQVKKGLGLIDQTTAEGKRDYVLLSIALSTGRRVSEMADLRYGHIQMQTGKAVILWERCKGNKQMQDVLSAKLTSLLFDYLHTVYEKDLYQASKDTPIWVSFSNKNRGEALSSRSLERICEKHLGTSKFHTTRHTCAMEMYRQGIHIKDISDQLGHANVGVTSNYLKSRDNMTGKHIQKLEEVFGI